MYGKYADIAHRHQITTNSGDGFWVDKMHCIIVVCQGHFCSMVSKIPNAAAVQTPPVPEEVILVGDMILIQLCSTLYGIYRSIVIVEHILVQTLTPQESRSRRP